MRRAHDRLSEVDHLDCRAPGVDDAPVHDRVDRDRRAVLGQRLLSHEGRGRNTRINGERRRFDIRQQEKNAWAADTTEATQAQHDLALPFVADAQRRQDRDQQQNGNDRHANGRWAHRGLREKKLPECSRFSIYEHD